MAAGAGEGVSPSAALKDQGNEQFKSGNYLKAAALYTQAIKLDPDNATLYRFPLPFLHRFPEPACRAGALATRAADLGPAFGSCIGVLLHGLVWRGPIRVGRRTDCAQRRD